MRKKGLLGLIGLMVVTVAAWAGATFATLPVTRFGPFYNSNIAYDSAAGGQPGGQVRNYLCAATLLVGDVVYFSADNTVNKSATLANYNAIAGVVVGGTGTSDQAAYLASDLGTTACLVNQRAIVLRHGRTYLANDAGGTVARGVNLIPSSATAGKVMSITTAIDTNYRAFAKFVLSTNASTTGLADVNVK